MLACFFYKKIDKQILSGSLFHIIIVHSSFNNNMRDNIPNALKRTYPVTDKFLPALDHDFAFGKNGYPVYKTPDFKDMVFNADEQTVTQVTTLLTTNSIEYSLDLEKSRIVAALCPDFRLSILLSPVVVRAHFAETAIMCDIVCYTLLDDTVFGFKNGDTYRRHRSATMLIEYILELRKRLN